MSCKSFAGACCDCDVKKCPGDRTKVCEEYRRLRNKCVKAHSILLKEEKILHEYIGRNKPQLTSAGIVGELKTEELW